MRRFPHLPIFLILAGCLAMLARAPSNTAGADDVPAAVLQAEQQRIDAIAKATRATIYVFSSSGGGGGSGVVITPDGYALTNFHVAKPSGDHMKCSLPDGKLYDAVVVGLDPTGDVALIKLLGRDDFPTAQHADSDRVQVGQWCFVVGNPFLLATDFQPTVTWGLVSGVHRYQYPSGTLLEYADCIQTDAAINPGNSGGPLFNSSGQLIGINGRGSFEKRGRVNVGVGYALSINQIMHFMGYLRSGRIVDHATLGASVSTEEDGRVVVSNILQSSDAFRRGLRYGDEIVAFGGRPIRTVNAFKNVLGIFPRAWRVPLSYRRDGERYDVVVRLAGVHSHEALIAKTQGNIDISPPDKDGKKPNGKRKDGPKLPKSLRLLHKKPPMPKHVAKYFKTRSGYANYYFNRLERDRVYSALVREGDFTKSSGPWKLSGELSGGGPVEIQLDTQQALVHLPTDTFRVDLTKDLDTELGPPGSGGLVVALHLWQRFLTVGPSKYGEVYYLGTAPMRGRDKLVDVLVATHNVTQTWFMFDPDSGRLLGIEMFPERDADPCEIYFGDYRIVDGLLMPHRLEVHHGDDIFSVIRLKEINLPRPAGKET